MKYIIVLGDGMADLPNDTIGGHTPLEVANKPTIDRLCTKGELGLSSTVPDGMEPGSDVANLSVMGYDPKRYYSGRSPLEAVSIGIELEEGDICFRCNLVTLSDDEPYEKKTIIDHSASEITTEESTELLKVIDEAFSDALRQFHGGVSYRHALVWKNGSMNLTLTPPHNILAQCIESHLPKGDHSDLLLDLHKRSYKLLDQHPVNQARAARGLNKANSIWVWGEGTKPNLTAFESKFGKKGAMISAVDLLKGIALAANMTSIDVPGANGTLHTNYKGKVEHAVKALSEGMDFVYLHIEAPDECGHQGNMEAKIKSVELLDSEVVKPGFEALTASGEDFRMLIMPDHPTPIAIRTHTRDPVPYVLYDSRGMDGSGMSYTEANAATTGIHYKEGHRLMGDFLELKD